jgi:hypothetical protein
MMPRTAQRVFVIAFGWTTFACAERPITAPANSGVAAASGGSANATEANGVAICHRNGGSKGYKLIWVSYNAVRTHFAHGDAPQGGALGADCRGGGGSGGGSGDPGGSYSTRLWGGPGGNEFDDACPAGSVGVGLSGAVATWYGWASVALLQLRCRAVLPGGSLGDEVMTPQRGTAGAVTLLIPFDASCVGEQLLVGAHGSYHDYMSSLGGKCATPARVAGLVGGYDSSIGPFSGVGDFGANLLFDATCPPGQVITGLYGRSGDIIDAFGFRCSTLPAP